MNRLHDTQTRDLFAWAGVTLPLAIKPDRRRPDEPDDTATALERSEPTHEGK